MYFTRHKLYFVKAQCWWVGKGGRLRRSWEMAEYVQNSQRNIKNEKKHTKETII